MANIVNRKATKEFILRICEAKRKGWECERVSKQALDEIEAFIKIK